MSSLCLDIDDAKKILWDCFHIQGTIIPLPGELDKNFKIKTTDGNSLVLKISSSDADDSYLDFQQAILTHLEKNSPNLETPKMLVSIKGTKTSEYTTEKGQTLYIRLLTWISGRVWSTMNPITDDLRCQLGHGCGQITHALKGFDHPHAHRYFEWDLAQGLWTREYLHLFTPSQKEVIATFLDQFESVQSSYSRLPKSMIHNDANDNNCILSSDVFQPQLIGIIDYGDAIFTQVINDLAIACSYAVMHQKDPLESALALVKGYHKSYPLSEEELDFLYICIAIRLIISVTKSAINKKEEPENTYLTISERPAWDLLNKWKLISSEFAGYSFRDACGFSAHPNQKAFENWASKQSIQLSDLFADSDKKSVHFLDLSISSNWLGTSSEFQNANYFQFKIDQLQKEHFDSVIAGGYLEHRPLYTSSAYDKIGNHGIESRCVHLGVDFWLPSKTAVFALWDGVIEMVLEDQGDKTYGGLIVLKHQTDTFEFYSLYGHLSLDSIGKHKKGTRIFKGSKFAELGTPEENGNWAPHLHFQLMLTLLNYNDDFPGVTYPNQKSVWKSICPDPNLFFKQSALDPQKYDWNHKIFNDRKLYLGSGMSLQYQKPLHIVRGEGVYLIDYEGRKYIDTVNNVAHVGHEHPRVVKKGQEQMAVLNTNSRYLHKNITQLAKTLLQTLPSNLEVIHFVNSGSEANELALRMIKTVTNSNQMIVSEVGYHGNTNGCVDISSYKFDGKGGRGAPENTHIIPIPDSFRGKHRGESTGSLYAEEVKKCIEKIHNKKEKVGGFIIEPIISCGGQIELPTGFLKSAYEMIRKAGGLCVSDEVQTGCGRMGRSFWGFQLHGVVPDIITIGKPLGNGHPVAAVACTRKVAKKFANGMEFFNTFGGNPVSCAIAQEVLDVVREEKLQENALHTGHFLKEELKHLSRKFPIIGSVRGEGLFLGIELVDTHLNPLKKEADYLVNRMKDFGFLMSTDGPDQNVIKIKPPIIFDRNHASQLVFYLEKVLQSSALSLHF